MALITIIDQEQPPRRVQLVGQDGPPLRWVAGADAVAAVEQKANTLLAQADAHRELSSSLAHDDAT
jgi:hypothetical protein